MSLITMIKLLATLLVVVVLGFTALLSWHVAVEPLGGVFEKIMPEAVGSGKKEAEGDLIGAVEAAGAPAADPGLRPYRRAREMLAMGQVTEARENLEAMINSFPTSASAPDAKKILGEMNLDELLSAKPAEGKQVVRVARGDSYLAIAARHRTTLENLLHLNGMLEMRGLRPDDELLVMALDFRVLIEPGRRALSVWDAGRFVCEYPLLEVPGSVVAGGRATEVESKTAEDEAGRRVMPGSGGYAAATKVIHILQPPLRIQSRMEPGEGPTGAILLAREDMEELNLLIRKGNTIEFR